ncbi:MULTISPECIES: hypothetical protein [Bacillota]|nr:MULTISPECIES: hypothetical protein [Bacillota]MCU7207665.1 hypothetical protein [Turicibacter sp. GALT-G1]
MEKKVTKQFLSYTKKAAIKKNPSISSLIKGVGSQKYSIDFIKQGY